MHVSQAKRNLLKLQDAIDQVLDNDDRVIDAGIDRGVTGVPYIHIWVDLFKHLFAGQAVKARRGGGSVFYETEYLGVVWTANEDAENRSDPRTWATVRLPAEAGELAVA